jgi:hypothetical protein
MAPAAGESRGRGVSISTRSWGSNRPCPHAQIFFLSAKPLIIFFEIKQSNGGALSPERQCRPSQALTSGVPGGGCVLDGFPRICFQSQFGQTRGRLNLRRVPDPGPHGSFLRRISKLNTESPPWVAMGSEGGVRSLGRCRPGTVARPHAFPRNSNLFLSAPKQPRRLGHAQNRREIQGGGGSVARHDEEIDVQKSTIPSGY